MTSTIGQLDETGEALWRELETAWDDPSAHDRFVGHAFAHNGLVAAAARYRARLVERPDDEKARQMIARVAFLATQALTPSARPGPPLSRSPLFLAVVLAAAIAGALFGVLYGAGR